MKAFIKRLVAMDGQEEALREEIMTRGDLYLGYHPEMRALHEAHVAEVEAFLDGASGGNVGSWPSLKALGEEGYDALFMIALNGISRPSFMRRAWEGFSSAKDPSSKRYGAYLADRIAYFERNPQLYGTQFDINVVGETVLWPVVAPEELDARRKTVGLEPYQELDFAIVDLDLGQGLKRQIGQYHFLYSCGWLCPSDREIKRLFAVLSNYVSGGILGRRYSQQHHQGLLSERTGNIDMIMPLAHKDAFEDFVREGGHTVVTRGLTAGSYALKDDLGYIHLDLEYIEFVESENEDEADWHLKGLNLDLTRATEHTVNGWILAQ